MCVFFTSANRQEAARGATAPSRTADKRTAEVGRQVTASGQRPRFMREGVFFVPECGLPLSGSMDSTHASGLRLAVISCIATNPGITEQQLLERFWSYPACHVRATIQAMLSRGELRCCVLTTRPVLASVSTACTRSGVLWRISTSTTRRASSRVSMHRAGASSGGALVLGAGGSAGSTVVVTLPFKKVCCSASILMGPLGYADRSDHLL